MLYRDLLNDSISTTETGHNFLTLRVTVTRQNLGKLVQIFIHNLNQQSAASGNSQIFLRLDPDGTVKYVHRPTPEAAVTTTSAGVKVTTGVPYVFTVWMDMRATGSTNRDTWGFSYALASVPETPVWTSADLWTCVDAGAQPRTLAIVGGSDGNFSAQAYFTVHDVRFESRPFQLPTVILLR